MTTESGPRVRMNPADRRQQLLHLAAEAFALDTYESVAVSVIADTAGVSEGLVFKYFPTKAALYAAVLEDARLRLEGALDDVERDLPVNTSAADRIRGLLIALMGHIETDRINALTSASSHMEPTEARAVRAVLRDDLVQRVSRIVDIKESAGDAIAVRGFIGFVEITLQDWAAAGRPEDDRWPIIVAAIGALQGALGDWQR